MASYTVYYTATASIPITVEVDTDGMDRDEAVDAIDAAASAEFGRAADTRLCHHCSGRMDIGDFEPTDEIDGLADDFGDK